MERPIVKLSATVFRLVIPSLNCFHHLVHQLFYPWNYHSVRSGCFQVVPSKRPLKIGRNFRQFICYHLIIFLSPTLITGHCSAQSLSLHFLDILSDRTLSVLFPRKTSDSILCMVYRVNWSQWFIVLQMCRFTFWIPNFSGSCPVHPPKIPLSVWNENGSSSSEWRRQV